MVAPRDTCATCNLPCDIEEHGCEAAIGEYVNDVINTVSFEDHTKLKDFRSELLNNMWEQRHSHFFGESHSLELLLGMEQGSDSVTEYVAAYNERLYLMRQYLRAASVRTEAEFFTVFILTMTRVMKERFGDTLPTCSREDDDENEELKRRMKRAMYDVLSD